MAQATRKTTTKSAPKLAKIEVKRSAPIPTVAPVTEQHRNNWVNINAAPSVLGEELLKQIKRAVSTHLILEERDSPIRSRRAQNAADTFANTLALVPPKSAIEALAAAIFIQVDIDLVANGTTDLIKREAAERIEQRAVTLVSWIETTHKVDRCEWGLDFFCGGDSESALIPHAARTLNVLSTHDR
jgi:hypothetical protein